MTTEQGRKQVLELFRDYPIIMSQGSVGDFIKREFIKGPAPEELGLSGMIYDKMGNRGLEYCWRDYTETAARHNVIMMLMPYSARKKGIKLTNAYYIDRNISLDNFYHCRSIVDGYPEIRNKILIGTTMGFSGDPYKPETGMAQEDAFVYNQPRAEELEESFVVHVRTGLTPSLPEAAGCGLALSKTSIPYRISLLLRKDGCLMDGTRLHDAVAYMEDLLQDNPPMFYQGQCTHPRNMMKCLDQSFNRTELVRTRVLGLEGNGSVLSPEELDNSPVIHSSPPDEWADDMMRLYTDYHFKMLGGCCGTFHHHIDELAARVRDVYNKFGLD